MHKKRFGRSARVTVGPNHFTPAMAVAREKQIAAGGRQSLAPISPYMKGRIRSNRSKYRKQGQ
jgi:hypothetical protein